MPPADTLKQDREARLAAQLRANLRRRKEHAAGRKQAAGEDDTAASSET